MVCSGYSMSPKAPVFTGRELIRILEKKASLLAGAKAAMLIYFGRQIAEE
jgi:hypothetical protein